ncbi:MAG: DUF3418 domain-containing protein, partial [Acidimicrobiia bacterium]
VPGLREELVTTLLRSLPKATRRDVGPAPDLARPFVASHKPADGPLPVVLASAITEVVGYRVLPDEFDQSAVPDYLRMTFRLVNESGQELVAGKDLAALRRKLAPSVRAAVARSVPHIESSGLREWSIGDLPRVVSAGTTGALKGYPALVDEGSAVGVRIFSTSEEQAHEMWRGTRRLLLLTVPPPARAVDRVLPNSARLAVAQLPLKSLGEVVADCIEAAADDLLATHGGPVWTAEDFAELRARVRRELSGRATELAAEVAPLLVAAAAVNGRTARLTAAAFDPAVLDMRAQLERLVGSGFVTRAGAGRLADLRRYVQAMDRRLDKLADDLARDTRSMRVVQALEGDVRRLRQRAPAAAEEVMWLIEELRVSLWAQSLGTRVPVSEKRVLRMIEDAFAQAG